MAEEDSNFDLSLKKKKKKKKTFDLDAAIDATDDDKGTAGEAGEAGTEDVAVDLESFGKKKKKKKVVPLDDDVDDNKKEVEDDIDLDTFGKKKKKKKDALNLDDLDEALPDKDDAGDLDLESFGKKKKKKKRVGEAATVGIDDDNEDDKKNAKKVQVSEDCSDLTVSEQVQSEEVDPWTNSDRDYNYDELLQRVFNIMKDKNPNIVSGESNRRIVVKPPQVMRVGTKKTAFVNFSEMAKMLHRQPKHLLAFLFAELGTVGAIDGNNQLIIKGRFQQKHIESVLRRYIKEYVTCHTCRSPDTILNKETRLFFLQCMSCHSRCSVQTIKTGFQAVTSKRSANRNKQ